VISLAVDNDWIGLSSFRSEVISAVTISLDAPKTYIKVMKASLSSVFHLLDVCVPFRRIFAWFLAPLLFVHDFRIFNAGLSWLFIEKTFYEYLDACNNDTFFIKNTLICARYVQSKHHNHTFFIGAFDIMDEGSWYFYVSSSSE